MVFEYEEAVEIVERLVGRLLLEAEIDKPPVRPHEIAKKLRITCTESELEGRRGQNLSYKGFKYIDIRKSDRAERKCFTMAHEILEMELPDSIRDKASRHELAMLGAPLLLMPTSWFAEECARTGYDLFELKKSFQTASHEAIALRTLAFEPAVITVVDDGKLSNRKSSIDWFTSRRLLACEREAAGESLRSGVKTSIRSQEASVEAYPLLDEEVKRVILRTVPNSDLP